MKIGPYHLIRIRIRRPRPIAGDLTEPELNAALQLPDNHPTWQALMQLLTTATDNAHMNANASINQTNELAGYTAGAQHLKMFREELENRRAIGQQDRKPTMSRPR